MLNPLEGLISAAPMPKLFFVDSQSEAEAHIVATICRATSRKIVRITGGCGLMSEADAAGFLNLFTEAFEGFDGALLFGGTRMLNRTVPYTIRPGITEVGPAIRRKNGKAVVVGVIAKTAEMVLTEHMIVGDNDRADYFTIVHPDQDVVLVVDVQNNQSEKNYHRRARHAEICDLIARFPALHEKYPADRTRLSPWDGEVLQCSSLIRTVHAFSGYDPLLVAYNGGLTTLKEIVDHVDRGWRALIIEESGRVADDILHDVQFRRAYGDHLVFAKPEVESFRAALEQHGFVPARERPEPQFLPFKIGG